MQVARFLCDWKVDPKTTLFRRIARFGVDLGSATFSERSSSFFLAALWIVSKYGTQATLRNLLSDHKPLWSNSEFLSRQVAASTSKFRSAAQLRWAHELIEKHGFRSAVSVINAIRDLKVTTSIPKDVRLYVLNGRQKRQYSLQRFLVLFQLLTAQSLPVFDRNALKAEALKYIDDPHYRRVIAKA